MPYINKKTIKPKSVPWKKHADADETRSEDFYNSKAWKRLRMTYIASHPVCEECLKHEQVTPAEEVHHLMPFMAEKTAEARWSTFLNDKNLRALCRCCHYAYHYKMRKTRADSCDGLTEDEWMQSKMSYSEGGD